MFKAITGTSSLKIDYFDIVGIEINENVENLRSGLIPKNRVLETFSRVDKLPFAGLNIKFSDECWDFSQVTNLPIQKSKFIFSFNPSSQYTDILKMYVLNEIIKKNIKIRSLQAKFLNISKFLYTFEQYGYSNLSKVPKIAYKRLFDSMEDCAYNTICAYKGHLIMFIDFYERTFESLNDASIKKYLEDRNIAKINRTKEANKTPEVPIDYFPIFLDGVKLIMRDEKRDNEHRITAASIILFSQIGFRTSEFLTVEADSLDDVYSPKNDKPLFYLTFKSFKHGNGENGGTIARTYVNDLSLEAYNLLMVLCKRNREKLNTNTLFVSKFQKNKTIVAQIFAERYRKFMLRHWKELQCLNIGDEYKDLESYEVGNYFKIDKRGHYTYDKNADWAKDLKMDDRIYYPLLRQFRVSVCTSLYRQQIPLHYIKKHMNHLSEDMAAYYIRPEKNIEKEYSESVYRAVFKDGSKMVGKNSDAFIQKINDYLAENNINIKANTEEVIQTIAKKFPLRSKVGGMCIRCGDIIPCASNTSTDVIYCAFGMCPNHCHMFFMADISYTEYLRQKEFLQYNLDNNFKKAYQKELNKLRYIIENSLLPELNMLNEEVNNHGIENIIDKYPQLTYIANHTDEIEKEIKSWIKN